MTGLVLGAMLPADSSQRKGKKETRKPLSIM